MNTSRAKVDIYTRVTDQIVAALDAGTRPWCQPWKSASGTGTISRPLRLNGIPYRGINVLLLWNESQEKGYSGNLWMTYKQAESLGANVRKGEHGAMVVYANTVTTKEVDDQGDEVEQSMPFLKAYTVFNLQQIGNLPADLVPHRTDETNRIDLMEEPEAFFRATGASFRHAGNRAFFAPGDDFIQLPDPQSFKDSASYAATKAHELAHWSGHKDRLAREFGVRFGDAAYAFEELVAELSSAFLCADMGISMEPRADHAAYLSSWLQVLKQDKRAIFAAAAHAQKAVDYLHNLVLANACCDV
jgi:antirestriction protein ArdC